jgi:hypothetical protein
MTRTKLDTPAFADQSVDTRNIADGTIQAQDISGSITGTQLAGSIANDKLANSSFSISGSSLSLGASTSLGVLVTWQAVTVADGSTTLTAEAGKGYFLDTNTGVIEVFLPTSPSRGDTIILVDYSGTFATNKCIVNTGTQNLDSTVYPEYKFETNNSIIELVYVDSSKGWQIVLNQAAGTTPSSALTLGQYGPPTFITATGGTITTDGDFKVHSFTGDANFIVSAVGNPVGSDKVDYLVVAGGGGGGADRAGGGGAGGFRTGQVTGCTGLPVSTTTYPITVGGGGAAGTYPGSTPGCTGSNSVFSTITSAGGGGGGQGGAPGVNGGSGGGGGGQGGPGGCSLQPGGTGNTPPVSPPQGNSGGTGAAPNSPTDTDTRGSGGGGGASAVGGNAVTGSFPGCGSGGDGGAGSPITAIFGCAPKPFYGPTSGVYAGGGGGGTRVGTNTGGDGGPGGGGDGGDPNAPTAGAGVANTGGGGGGAEGSPTYDGAAGGKGIVLIRYKFQ